MKMRKGKSNLVTMKCKTPTKIQKGQTDEPWQGIILIWDSERHNATIDLRYLNIVKQKYTLENWQTRKTAIYTLQPHTELMVLLVWWCACHHCG